jgi:hypothetical protein
MPRLSRLTPVLRLNLNCTVPILHFLMRSSFDWVADLQFLDCAQIFWNVCACCYPAENSDIGGSVGKFKDIIIHP